MVFDVGETLIDESRLWIRWAQRLDVTPLSLVGALGAMAALDRPISDAFQLVRPGIDLHEEMERWRRDDPDGLRENFDVGDLYPDVREAFTLLRGKGARLLIAGNQPVQAGAALELMDLGAEAILISDLIGVHKPHPEFFAAVADRAGIAPEQIVYVGDRVDNDVIPAKQAGMHAVLIRRGPWGYLHAQRPEAAKADAVIDSLLELVDVIAALPGLASPAPARYRSGRVD